MKWKIKFICLLIIITAGCAPTITNVVPYSGKVGDTVRIHGEGLTEGTGNPTLVDFNGVPASFSLDGSTIVAKVPAGATSGPIHAHRNRVDRYTPEGDAYSPADFSVIAPPPTTDSSASFNDNTRNKANTVPFDSNAIEGNLSMLDAVDFFRIPTDPGPYGYTLEFHATASLPKHINLQVVVTDADEKEMCTINIPWNDTGNKPHICWTAQPPGPDNVYLEVSYSGSGTVKLPGVNYSINIAKIPINDARETMDDGQTPHRTTPITPDTPYTKNYLGVTNAKASSVFDYYRFSVNGAGSTSKVYIAVSDAGLPDGDAVVIGLLKGPITADLPFGQMFGMVSGNQNEADLLVPDVPNGQYRVHIANPSMRLNNSGSGSAPLCFKRPYSLTIKVIE